jgi:hypothetical protein
MTAQPNQEDLAEAIKAAVIIMRIIVFALAMGSTMFLLIAAMLARPDKLTRIPTDPMAWIPVGVGALALVASFVVPGLIGARMRQQIARGEAAVTIPAQTAAELGDAGRLAMVYQTQLIVGCALLEGAAFFCAVFVMLDAGLPALLMAGLLIAAILVRIPSSSRLSSWILAQLRLIEAERTLSERNPLAEG